MNITKENILNTYRKWKNIIYFSNNLLYKKKIVDFEASISLDECITNMVDYLNHPTTEQSINYINSLVKKINFYILPKKVKYNSVEDNILISSNEDKNGYLQKVNFFIDAPVEIYVLDLFLTLNIGFYAFNKNKILSDLTYSNKFKTSVFQDNTINYKERETFEIYYYQYQKWRNNAFDKASQVLDNGKNVVILNYDIEAFYYNANINFETLLDFLPNDWDHYIPFFKTIYSKYTSLVSKYKTNIFKHKANNYMLPIGLESSKLFSDLYLREYDLLKHGLVCFENSIVYYGRYVDDILIVVETNQEFKDKQECINQINNDFNLFEFNKKDMCLFNYPNLKLQMEKTDIYYFKSEDKNKYLHVYGAKMRTQASNVGDFFDDDFFDKDYVDLIYRNDRSSYYTKFSDIKSSKVDKLALSRYLTKALNLYKFTDLTKSDTDGILNVISYELSYLNFLDNFTLIEKLFKLLIVLGYEKTINFYSDQRNYVSKELNIEKIENVKINNKFKKCLINSLTDSIDAAYCLAVCVTPKKARKNKDVIIKYRKSLMFDRKLLCIPFIQYHNISDDCNLMDSSNLEDLFETEFKKEKFKLCPYTPSFPEYELYTVLKTIYNNERIDYGITFRNYWNLIEKTYSKQPLWKNNQYYKDSNKKKYGIHKKDEDGKLEFITIFHEPSLNVVNLENCVGKKQKEDLSNKQKEFEDLNELGISIASLPLDDKDLLKRLKYKKAYKNINYKRQIFKVLNDSKKHKDTHFIVFPELSIPIDWLTDLIFYCKNYNKSIIFGMSYIFQKTCNGCFARNIVGAINYYKDKGTYNQAKVILKEKNFYPYEERAKLNEYGLCCKDSTSPFYYVVKFRGIKYSFMVCFELTDIASRSSLKNHIDNLFVPVLNKDTSYFSNIVNSTARDLYCYVSMANTSRFGDSRITGPFDSVHKDIVQIKGGDNAFCIIGKVDIKGLHQAHDNEEELNEKRYKYKKKQHKKELNFKFKPLSAGVKKRT